MLILQFVRQLVLESLLIKIGAHVNYREQKCYQNVKLAHNIMIMIADIYYVVVFGHKIVNPSYIYNYYSLARSYSQETSVSYGNID